MSNGPTVDGRTREELLAEVHQRADDYTTEWDPTTEDAGTTLLTLFSEFGMDVLSRLNDVPHKHRVAFLGALDFDRRPPQSARVPLTFTTTGDIGENVVVSGGTQVTAETPDDETVIFEIPQSDGFEATGATLRSVVSVDPESNSIYDHDELADRSGPARLFTGRDRQAHEFYLCHEELLNVDAESTITVSIETEDQAVLDERATWEYFGENEDGEVGWHQLPRETPDIVDDPFGDEVALEEKMQRVSDRVQFLGEGTRDEDEHLYSPTFRFPGPTAAHVVDETESHWIRVRAPGDEQADFDVELDSVRLAVEGGADENSRRPSMVFSNDVPITVDDGDFYPFGRTAQPPTTLYLSSEEAFTKKGGTVSLQFTEAADEGAEDNEDDEDDEDDSRERLTPNLAGPLSGPPELSWEYWNGSGWIQLSLETDETESFRSAGEVAFTVPEDFQATSVSGHEDHWIRVRLVGGNYGQPEYELTDDGRRGELVRRPDPPVFGDITLSYGQRGASFEQLKTHNNASYETVPEPSEYETSEPLAPFEELPDRKQTFYLGFDAPLHEGPINLHIPMEDKAYPRGFEPGIQWEYCTDPESWSWTKLDVYDGTEGLTERGIVNSSFPDPTTAFELFGRRRHWIRAAVTRDEFVTDAETAPVDRADDHVEEEVPRPPTLEAVNPNTQWAYNERTVEETLGGSDGSPDQQFQCENVPITAAEVWVDESEDLSVAEQRSLEDASPDDVRSGDDGQFWVQWEETPDFLHSTESSRHYLLDCTTGTITFGDGHTSAIPPSGDENIRVEYRTGGGSDGNVDAGAITDLRSSISRIDEVTNRKPSDGGTDVESLDEAVSRAPEQIKNRGRAVTAEDFEQIATESSRQLATVKCEPEMDDAGDQEPGWVTLLIIPRERRDRPTPSLELRQRVREAVCECAPATLVGGDSKRIVVRGPDYAEVSIETTVTTRGVESITNLKNTIETTLDGFFHPLTGGRDGDGWAFGTAPKLGQVTTLIEEVDGVDRVTDIAMTVETATEEKIIRDPEKRPILARDGMISSATHEVDIVMRGHR
jgi:hypothetical protein